MHYPFISFFLGNGASRGFQGHPYRPVNTYRQAHSYGPAHPMPSHSNPRYRPPFPINSPSQRFKSPFPLNRGLKRSSSPLVLDHSKKSKVNNNAVKPEFWGVQSICIKEEGGELFVCNSRSAPPCSPILSSDPRSSKTAISLPSTKKFPFFDNLQSFSLSCSFFGNNCTACNLLNGNHSIAKQNVFLLGDQFIPPIVGSQKECVPTIRISNPTFETLKESLRAQKKNGLGKNEGGVALVSILSYLINVGATEYLSKLGEFSEWVKAEMGWEVIPFVTPYPHGFPEHALITIQQFLSVIKAKFLGDFMGGVENKFSMWKPFSIACRELGMDKKILPVPPISFIKNNKTITIQCDSEVFLGSTKPNTLIESTFLPLLFNQLRCVSPPSSPLTIPSSDALLGGFSGSTNTPPITKTKLVLLGTSILKNCVEKIKDSATNSGFDVIDLCKGGDFFNNIKGIKLPISSNSNDTLVLLFLGNHIFSKSNHFKKDGVYHLENPKFLTDKQINSLIAETCNLISDIQLGFKGKIKLFGPLPRFSRNCCSTPHHLITPSFPFDTTGEYILYLNKFMAFHPLLKIEKVEFIPPTAIFGRTLPVPFTHDLVHPTVAATNTLSSYLKTISIKRVTSLPVINRKESESFYSWVTALKKPTLYHTPSFCSTMIPTPGSTSSPSNQTRTMTSGTSTSTVNIDDSSLSTSQASHIHHPSTFPDPSLLSDDETSDMELSKEDLAAALASLDMSFD